MSSRGSILATMAMTIIIAFTDQKSPFCKRKFHFFTFRLSCHPFEQEMKQTTKNFIQVLLEKVKGDDIRARLIKGATGIFFLNIVSSGILFITSIILARLLGVSEYGVYTYALALIFLLCIPAGFGLSRLLVRNMAAYQAQSSWELMHGMLRWSLRVGWAASIGVAVLAVSVSFLFQANFNQQMLTVFLIALPIIPLLTILRLKRSAMEGLHRVVIGQVPEMVAQPLLFIMFIIAAYFLMGRSITARWVIGLNVVSVGLALLMVTIILQNAFPEQARNAAPEYNSRSWISSAVPLLLMSGLFIINSRADIIMLGAIKESSHVGVYNVAVKGAELVMFISVAVNRAMGPTIASFYSKKESVRLQDVVTKSARITLLLSFPIAFVLVVFGYWFLLLFGESFTTGKTALSILVIGQLFNIIMGPIGLLLIMTGHEKEAASGVGISAIINIILNAIFIPKWGIEGAAAATVSSMMVWNIIMVFWVYRRLGIHSTVVGKIRGWRKA